MTIAVRLRDGEQFKRPAVQQLMLRAIGAGVLLPEVKTWEDVEYDLIKLVEDPDTTFIIVIEGLHIVGVCYVRFSTDKFTPWPQVPLIYNEGTVAAKRALVKAATQAVRNRGYDRFWAINRSGKSDAVWDRTLRAGKMTRIGSVCEIEV